jgi:hypothetical protein
MPGDQSRSVACHPPLGSRRTHNRQNPTLGKQHGKKSHLTDCQSFYDTLSLQGVGRLTNMHSIAIFAVFLIIRYGP